MNIPKKATRKEYRKILIRSKLFWLGIILIISGFIMQISKIVSSNIFLAVILAGFGLLIIKKYQILGKLKKKY